MLDDFIHTAFSKTNAVVTENRSVAAKKGGGSDYKSIAYGAMEDNGTNFGSCYINLILC